MYVLGDNLREKNINTTTILKNQENQLFSLQQDQP